MDWISLAHKVLKKTGSIYIVSGFTNLESILRGLRESGFTVINHIIWQFNFGPCTKYKYINSHYTIIYAAKDIKSYQFDQFARYSHQDLNNQGKKSHYKDRESVWYITKERWDGCWTTKTRLPLKIITKAIQYSSLEGDLIFDPFLGSGQTAWAAKELKRDYLGFELSKNHFNFASIRLKTNQYKITTSQKIS